MNKVTYTIDGKPVAIVTENQNKYSCELLGYFQILLIAMSNDITIEPTCGSETPFNNVSDLKKLVYGKDTFVIS